MPTSRQWQAVAVNQSTIQPCSQTSHFEHLFYNENEDQLLQATQYAFGHIVCKQRANLALRGSYGTLFLNLTFIEFSK
jgi:D-tyrosyl-tRNA(Tyr) deacylase